MTGYSSIPIYDQAKRDLAANYGDTVDAYDALFGNAVPALVAQQTPGGGGGGGAPTINSQPRAVIENQTKFGADRTITEGFKGGKGGRGNVGARKGSGKVAGVSALNKYGNRSVGSNYGGRKNYSGF
jgi:hypothetical protein